MSQPGLSATIARLRRAVAPDPDPPSDGRLLARFLQSRDEPAFAELVRRHGPMVLGVCRRLVHDRHLADDAFQAVFLTLARRADRLAGWESVGGWLRQVARRVGANARRTAARHRTREVSWASGGREPPESEARGAHPPRSPETEEVGPAVLEELARLPERFRVLLVLHYLEGRPQTEVAVVLGLPAGTVNRRMSEARRLLGDRLRARGLAPGLAGLGVVTVPAELSARAVAAAVSPHTVPAAVAALSNGVTRTMLVHKLLLVTAAGLLAAGVGRLTLAADPPKPAAVKSDPPKPAVRAADPKPLPKGPNKLLITVSGRVTLLDPDGRNPVRVNEKWQEFAPLDPKLSPDGKRYAVLHQEGDPLKVDPDNPPHHRLYVRAIGGPEPGTDTGLVGDLFHWSPDGTRVAVTEYGRPHDIQAVAGHHLYDARTGKATELRLPKNHVVTGWAPDDRLLTTAFTGRGQEPRVQRLWLMNLDGTEHRALTDGTTSAMWGAMAPDGKRVLCLVTNRPTKEVPDPPQRGPVVLDVATGKFAPIDGLPLNGDVTGYCWSPDGKRIAYAWRTRHDGPAEERAMKETEVFLVVCDPDGGNARTVLTDKGKEFEVGLGDPDWR